MIIALKDNDTIWLATGIIGNYRCLHTEDLLHEDNLKLWHPHNRPDFIMGVNDVSAPYIDELRYGDHDLFDGDLTADAIIRSFLPDLKSYCKDHDGLDEDGEMWRPLILAKGDRAFTVSEDFCVSEVEDFGAIAFGGNEDLALGALRLSVDRPPVERLTEAFRAVSQGSLQCYFPIVIMNTKNDEKIVVREDTYET